MATTTLGPISTQQLNKTLYVGVTGSLPTIQAAVNHAVAEGGIFVVVIPHSYGGSDTIAGVVNGSSSVLISDERGFNGQTYVWSGAAYTPANFAQLGAVTAPFYLFRGVATGGLPDFSGLIEFNPSLSSAPALSRVTMYSKSGNSTLGQFELSGVSSTADGRFLSYAVFDEELASFGIPIAAPFYLATAPATFPIDGNGTIDYEPSNSRTRIVSRSANSALGEFEISAASSIAAGKFQTYLVIDETKMQIELPLVITGDLSVSGAITAAGIPVQGKLTLTTLGSSGAATLIGNTLNIPQYAGGGMVYPGAGIGVSTGAAWGASINPATLATYPPAGLAVSTGAAWGAAISPATVPRTNIANTFTDTITAKGFTATGTLAGAPSSTQVDFYAGGARLLAMGATGAIAPQLTFTGLSGDGLNYWEYLKLSSDGTNYSALLVADLTVSAYGGVQGNITASGIIRAPQSIMGLTMTVGTENGLRSQFTPSSDSLYIDSFGSNPATNGTYTLRSQRSDGSGNIIVLSIDGAGNGHFAGDISAGTKSFRIPHPLNKKKNLTHGCIEGPEHAVYYRGEVKTAKGAATVTLPAYFEALTETEGRTVQLTLKADGDNFATQVAAGTVTAGKFKVYSSQASATVYWEVKAVRKGVTIEVESDRETA